MSISKSLAVASIVLGVVACGKSENVNNQATADATSETNVTQANAEASSGARPAEIDSSAKANANMDMPVPGTKTPEHVAHDMNNMGNMDMNHM